MSSLPLIPRIIACTLPNDLVQQPLLPYLVARFTYHTATEWQAAIDGHLLLINDHPATAQMDIHPNDHLRYDATHVPEPPVNQALETLYEDDELLVYNKPPNLPVHPSGRYFNHTVWGVVQRQGTPAPHFVNRLDRETSGVLLCTKVSKLVRPLSRQILTKRYQVLVHGHFPQGHQFVSGRLIPHPSSPIRKQLQLTDLKIATTCPPLTPLTPDQAITELRTLHQQTDTTLVEATLHTGRLHQIRATMLALGYPVVGDKLYGLDPNYFQRLIDDTLTPEDWQALRLPHQALHAHTLILTHAGKEYTFTAPCPWFTNQRHP